MAALACGGPKPAESAAPPSPSDTASEPAPPASGTTEPIEPAPPANAPEAPDPSVPPADAAVTQTLQVHERRADCQGEAPMKCLQVRESDNEPWRNFFGRIDGFDYEEGHAYELRVEVTRVPAPPADASNLRYRLIEVISKRKGG